jgi:hypothetical protein
MGKPKLVYSPIQLCMANQYCIYPIGRLQNVEVDLAGVKNSHTLSHRNHGGKGPIPKSIGHQIGLMRISLS